MSTRSTTAEAGSEARTEDMVIIHRILRRGFQELADLVRHTPAGDTRSAALVAGHADFHLNGLHHHHTAEDEHIWPRLLERAAPDAELVARMEAQHEAVAALTAQVRALLLPWRADPAANEELAAAIEGLGVALGEHLDEEESRILPIVRAHITPAEWRQVGERAFAGFTDDEKLIATGRLEETATPAERAMMMGDLPLPIRLFWNVVGRRRYTRHMQQVRRNLPRAANPRSRARGGVTGRVLPAVLRRANAAAVGLYRRTDGRVGGTAKGLPALLLTVPGRRTGVPHTVVVAYFPHGGGYIVAASSGGAKAEPQWIRNLAATSTAQVQIGGTVTDVAVRVPDRAERDALWSDVVLATAPFFADYERKSGRVIKVAVLMPASQ